MKKRYVEVCVFVCACLIMLFAGCGEKEYKVEYGIDGYVYIARRLQTMEGVDNLKLIDNYLYYMQDTDSGTAVVRVPAAAMAEGKVSLDFSEKETLGAFKNMAFELPEGTGEDEMDFFPPWMERLNGLGGIAELIRKKGMAALCWMTMQLLQTVRFACI